MARNPANDPNARLVDGMWLTTNGLGVVLRHDDVLDTWRDDVMSSNMSRWTPAQLIAIATMLSATALTGAASHPQLAHAQMVLRRHTHDDVGSGTLGVVALRALVRTAEASIAHVQVPTVDSLAQLRDAITGLAAGRP